MSCFFSWAKQEALCLHKGLEVLLQVLGVGKELLDVGAWFAYHVVDVDIMDTSTCLLVTIQVSLFRGSMCFFEGPFFLLEKRRMPR